jgi:hypothetical protein
VREWFGRRLEDTNPEAWCAAHGRVYEHLRDTTEEGTMPTLEDLAPLYQAIPHGCRAGRHEKALKEIFQDRICRTDNPRVMEFYARDKLGAIDSDLAAISWFFEKPYERPIAALPELQQSWVLSEAGRALGTHGRLAEALPAQRAGLQMDRALADWWNAAISASQLSKAELLIGEVAVALATSKQCVADSNRCGDEFILATVPASDANALHVAGRCREAERWFADIEQRQKEYHPARPLLYSERGYQCCDLLLAKGKCAAARDRASRTREWVKQQNWLLDVALDTLTLGRAHLGPALEGAARRRLAATTQNNARTADARFGEAVDGLRAAGALPDVPRGLLARAVLHRSVGDWNGVARDLDEVEEIAEPGPMRLYLCDMAIERTRLAFARIEAFAPLNGLLENSPPKPEPPSEAERKNLRDEAAKQLSIAADYISKCGYHRRDEELAELQDVLAGQRRFADLPPRV